MTDEAANDLPRHDERAIAVRLRDNEQCQACSRTASESTLEIHRIVPVNTNQMSNFVLLCKRCHAAAHQRDAPTASD